MGFFRLLVFVIGLALLGAVVGAGLFVWTRPASFGANAPIPVSIGSAAFRIPPAYVRGGALPRPGSQERVDLVLAFPGLEPAGNSPAPGSDRLFLALLREDGVMDPSERVNDIYGRFLEPDIWQNPGGLLLRRFAVGSPYADEELYISPPDGRVFTARCRKPTARTDVPRGSEIGETCLWRFRMNGADALLRFSPDLLPQWMTLAESLRERITQWQRP